MVELGLRFPLQGPGSLRWELRPPQSLLSPPSIARELSETQTPLGRKWRPRFWPFIASCAQIKNKTKLNFMQWFCPAIPALRRRSQGNKFETRFSYRASSRSVWTGVGLSQKQNKTNNTQTKQDGSDDSESKGSCGQV